MFESVSIMLIKNYKYFVYTWFKMLKIEIPPQGQHRADVIQENPKVKEPPFMKVNVTKGGYITESNPLVNLDQG